MHRLKAAVSFAVMLKENTVTRVKSVVEKVLTCYTKSINEQSEISMTEQLA